MTMGKKKSGIWKYIPEGVPCSVIVFGMFTYIGMQMGVPQMLNTIMKTAHDLLLNTCFYLMAICVITGAIGKIFVEFSVVKLLERLLRFYGAVVQLAGRGFVRGGNDIFIGQSRNHHFVARQAF